MRKSFLFIIAISIITSASAGNTININKKLHLKQQQKIQSAGLSEVSGAALVNGKLWVLNDGDNGNAIYRIDSIGNILQKVIITNAVNHDWEELSYYDNHLYIGDFGNNTGLRKKLSIYKLNIDQLSANATEAQAKEMSFSCNDLSISGIEFNFEAMIPMNGEIHLFSKSKTGRSSHCVLSDDIDFQFIKSNEVIQVEFEITAASTENNNLYIAGYNLSDFSIQIMTLQLQQGRIIPAGTQSVGSVVELGQVESLIIQNNKILMISEQINRGFLHFPAMISVLE